MRIPVLVLANLFPLAIFAGTVPPDAGSSSVQYDSPATEAAELRVRSADFPEFQRFLLPIAMETIPGAYGSLWKTEFLVHNANDSRVLFIPMWPGCDIRCPDSLDPESSSAPPLAFRPRGEAPGLFVFAEKHFAGKLTFNLRVQDLSRQAQTWGTEIPVISEAKLFTGSIQLLNVPSDPRFRVLLRIYDFDSLGDAEVEVRGYRLFCCDPSSGFLGKTVVRVGGGTSPDPRDGEIRLPGYAELGHFAELWGFSPGEPMRLEIVPLTSGLRFWAFATVTNNETQHVTTITPQ